MFLKVINKPITYKYSDITFKDFANHRKKANRVVVFSHMRLSLTFFNSGNTDEIVQQSGKQNSFRHLLKKSSASKFRLIVLQNHHWNTVSTRCRWGVKVGYDLNHLGNYTDSMDFQRSSIREVDKEIPESSRLELLKKFLANIVWFNQMWKITP